jgi:hypothetical protein
METPGPHPERNLDEATSRRLAKLGNIPFDTSKLKMEVETSIAGLQPGQVGRRKRRFGLAVVAVIAVAVSATVALWPRNNAVLASPAILAQVHREVLSGATHSTPVTSYAAARTVLSAQWPDGPQIPRLSGDHVVACCVHQVGHKKMACLLLQADGVPCSFAIANARDVRINGGDPLKINGVTYHVQSAGSVNMVMATRDELWFCLMGELPITRLAEMAGSMRL